MADQFSRPDQDQDQLEGCVLNRLQNKSNVKKMTREIKRENLKHDKSVNTTCGDDFKSMNYSNLLHIGDKKHN
jgi:hypothetical protein